MNKCPRVGETDCPFSPGSHCKHLKWEGDVFDGEFVKECEVCDVVVEYWDNRKECDNLRRLKRIVEGAKY